MKHYCSFSSAGSNWVNSGAMNTPRGSHTATLLPDGQVLVTGGLTNSLIAFTALSSAELFNPATQTWSDTGDMTTNRVRHTATLLPNGKVLVTGGVGGAGRVAAQPRTTGRSGVTKRKRLFGN